MADITMSAQVRTVTGKKVSTLRRQGLIPANIYGRGVESLPVQVDMRAFRTVLAAAGTSTVVDVHVVTDSGREDGKRHPVLIEHVSVHPSTGKVLHIDLRQVDLNRPVRTAVPVLVTGEAPAVTTEGGVLMQLLDTIEVEALPRQLPQQIEVDITGLVALDSQITLADLRLPAGVTVDTDPETVVVRVMASKLEQEVAAEEAEAAAEAAEAAEEAGEGEATEGADAGASGEAGDGGEAGGGGGDGSAATDSE